jgi:hypothetical protein
VRIHYIHKKLDKCADLVTIISGSAYNKKSIESHNAFFYCCITFFPSRRSFLVVFFPSFYTVLFADYFFYPSRRYQLHHPLMDEAQPIFSSSVPQKEITIYHKVHTHLTDPSHVLDIFSTVLQHNPVRIKIYIYQ